MAESEALSYRRPLIPGTLRFRARRRPAEFCEPGETKVLVMFHRVRTLASHRVPAGRAGWDRQQGEPFPEVDHGWEWRTP
jgi:hypothetical protein